MKHIWKKMIIHVVTNRSKLKTKVFNCTIHLSSVMLSADHPKSCWHNRSGKDSSGVNKGSPLNHSVEAVDGISGVDHSPDLTVGFDQTVGSLDYSSIPGLFLTLAVSGDGVVDVVREGVLRERIVRVCHRGGT